MPLLRSSQPQRRSRLPLPPSVRPSIRPPLQQGRGRRSGAPAPPRGSRGCARTAATPGWAGTGGTASRVRAAEVPGWGTDPPRRWLGLGWASSPVPDGRCKGEPRVRDPGVATPSSSVCPSKPSCLVVFVCLQTFCELPSRLMHYQEKSNPGGTSHLLFFSTHKHLMEEKPPGRALLREVTQRNKLQRERLRWHSCCSCRYLGRLGQSLSLHSRDVRAERGRHTTCNCLLSSLLLVCLLPLLHRASTALMCYIINLCYVGNPVILSAGQL